MTDDSASLPPEPDDLVTQVVERAATKVADAAAAPAARKLDRWIYVGVVGVAVLVILAAANLVVNVQTKNAVVSNQEKIGAACKLIALAINEVQAPSAPLRLAECLK
jgi:negative regulator of sigma E activity